MLRGKVSNNPPIAITSKIKANKTADQIIKKEILDKLYHSTIKFIDISKRIKSVNLNEDIKNIAKKWGFEMKRYLRDN